MTSVEAFIAMQTSPETRRAYTQDLRRWAEFSEGKVIDPNLVVAFRDHLSETLAPRSAARNFSTVRTYHRWLVATGQGTTNLFEAVKGPKTTRNATPTVPSDEDVDALVEASRRYPRWQAVVALLLNGLRASEVGGLLRDNINWTPEGYYMKVIGKGQRERLVPMTEEAVTAVAQYNNDPTTKASLFAVSDVYGAPLSGHAIRDIVYDVARWAKVKDMHPHALRHHYGTRLARAGVPIIAIRDLLGHTSVDTTQIYVNLDLSDLFEAARLDPRQDKEKGLRAVS